MFTLEQQAASIPSGRERPSL